MKASANFDSIVVTSITWSSNPTFNWGKRYTNGVNSLNQNSRLIAYPDSSKVICTFTLSSTELIIYILNVADGSLVSKAKIAGFPSKPYPYDMLMKGSTSLYLITRNGIDNSNQVGNLFDITLSDFSTTAYNSNANTYLASVNGPFTDGTY